MNNDQGDSPCHHSISCGGIQNVMSPKHKGSVSGCGWVGCVAVNLNEDVNMYKT